MRTLVAIASVTLFLALAPAAAATFWPPRSVLLSGVHPFRLPRAQPVAAQLSCAAKSRNRRSEIERKLQPVACEQPPRSNVLDGSFVIPFAP